MILVGERTNMLILQQQKNKKINRHFFVYLWDDGEFGPQVVKAYFSYLHVIDGDLSCCGFQQPEEAESHGGLAGACATHNANLGSHKNRDIRKPSSPPVTCLVAWSINLSFYHIFFFFLCSDYQKLSTYHIPKQPVVCFQEIMVNGCRRNQQVQNKAFFSFK